MLVRCLVSLVVHLSVVAAGLALLAALRPAVEVVPLAAPVAHALRDVLLLRSLVVQVAVPRSDVLPDVLALK